MIYLSDPRWEAVLTSRAVWPANSYLLRQGTVPPNVYVLDEGVIKMVHVTEDGKESVIDIQRAPALVGVGFVFAGRPSNVDAVTVTRASLRWCAAQAFLSALATDAQRLDDVLRWHGAEIVSLWERAVAMSTKTSKQRFDEFLARHAVMSEDREARPVLPFKQSLVAAFINVTPEHLSRLTKTMAKAVLGPRPGQRRPAVAYRTRAKRSQRAK
jgi:CRP-like cAMP-binding protein